MRHLLLLLLLPAPCSAQLRAGDVVFQDSGSAQSRLIREVTRSPWSHVGIVLPRDGALAVLEASGSVRWASVDAWWRRARGPVLVRRPRRALSPDDVTRLTRTAARWLGRGYDARFEWGDARMYCSELVYRLFERALGWRLTGRQRWRDLELGPRGRALARRRLGRTPEPSGLVVTPAALADSPSLVTVDTSR